MKYLKPYNDDEKDEMQDIQDIFLDVKDEFGLYRYEGDDNSRNGLFYSITQLGHHIKLWIANIEDWRYSYDVDSEGGKKLDVITSSGALRDFERRLRNMGYTLERSKNLPYYEIIIKI